MTKEIKELEIANKNVSLGMKEKQRQKDKKMHTAKKSWDLALEWP